MKGFERKEKTEYLLKEWNLPVYDNLPAIEEEETTQLKTAQEVAKRILILTYLNCAVQVEDKHEIITFLKEEKLWECVTKEEKELFEKSNFSEEEIDNILWRSESILLLLWTLHKVQALSLPVEEANIGEVIPHLPAFFASTSDFVNSATIRNVSEILDQADLIFRLHWALRQAEVEGSKPLDLHPGIVYERHYAIDWVTSVREKWE